MKRKFLLVVTLTIATQLFVNAQGKVLQYSFNKDFKDSISGANEGMVTGDVTLVWDADRKSTVAVFNENATEVGYVTLPNDILNTASLTVSCWAKHNDPNKVGNWGRFWDFGANNTNYILLSYSKDDSMVPTVDTKVGGVEGPRNQSTEAIVDGVWNHFVVTHGEGNTTLYVNGVEASTKANEQLLVDMFNAGENTNYLGKSHFDDSPLVGRLDDLIILDRVLSADDVAKLYADNLPLAVEKNEAVDAASILSAEGAITINVAVAGEGSIEVFDITGKKVFKSNCISLTNLIAVNGNSLYLVKLTQGKTVTTAKVFVK